MKYFFLLFFLLTLINCQSVEKNDLPDRLLSEQEMALVLMEVAQLKAIKSNYPGELKSSGIILETYLCTKFDVDSITLQENLRYYNYDPHKIMGIYQKALDSINESYTKVKAYITKREKLKQQRDSIESVNDSIEAIKEKVKDTLETPIPIKDTVPKNDTLVKLKSLSAL